MTTKDKVLRLLLSSHDEYLSGEKLAEKLNVSRTAVWKAIKSLQNDGFIIDAVTNRGYSLSSENNVVTPQTVQVFLQKELEVLCYPTLDSTNDEAKRLLSKGKRNAFLIVANEQTAGRGRQGKSFYSPANTGIYMTLVLHPMLAPKSALRATVAASVAVCDAVESLTKKEPMIKWVNDVYVDGKKICGILTEAITDFETQVVSTVIIGIGINIGTEDFPPEAGNAGSLGVKIKRSQLIAAITDKIRYYAAYPTYMEYYRNHSMVLGEPINYIRNGVVTPATAIDIDEEDAGLIVRLEDGSIKKLVSGEITIRKRED